MASSGLVRFGWVNNYFTEMCSGSEAGSYLRLIDFGYHSTLDLRVIKKTEKFGWEGADMQLIHCAPPKCFSTDPSSAWTNLV